MHQLARNRSQLLLSEKVVGPLRGSAGVLVVSLQSNLKRVAHLRPMPCLDHQRQMHPCARLGVVLKTKPAPESRCLKAIGLVAEM